MRPQMSAARLALAASLALAAATWATPALAGNPGGTPCASDGRIAGSGDTFGAALHQRVLAPGLLRRRPGALQLHRRAGPAGSPR